MYYKCVFDILLHKVYCINSHMMTPWSDQDDTWGQYREWAWLPPMLSISLGTAGACLILRSTSIIDALQNLQVILSTCLPLHNLPEKELTFKQVKYIPQVTRKFGDCIYPALRCVGECRSWRGLQTWGRWVQGEAFRWWLEGDTVTSHLLVSLWKPIASSRCMYHSELCACFQRFWPNKWQH